MLYGLVEDLGASRKAIGQLEVTVQDILQRNDETPEKAQELATLLSTGKWTHDYPIDYEQAKAMGLPVWDAMPDDVYALMALCRTPTQRRPGVEYAPIPGDGGRRLPQDRRS